MDVRHRLQIMTKIQIYPKNYSDFHTKSVIKILILAVFDNTDTLHQINTKTSLLQLLNLGKIKCLCTTVLYRYTYLPQLLYQYRYYFQDISKNSKICSVFIYNMQLKI